MLPPPLTEPKQVSIPAAARLGANAVGTFFRVCVPDTSVRELEFELTVAVVLAGLLMVREELEFPPFPRLMATAPAAELLSDRLTPMPVAVVVCAKAGLARIRHNTDVVARCFVMVNAPNKVRR